jgi:hypothetical protein
VNASTWIELAGLVLGGGGGGTAVAKMTRLVVAVERLAEEIKRDRETTAKIGDQVADHEKRLNRRGLLHAGGPRLVHNSAGTSRLGAPSTHPALVHRAGLLKAVHSTRRDGTLRCYQGAWQELTCGAAR